MENKKTSPKMYSPERLQQYRLAVAMADNMVKKALISDADRRIMLDALAQKYGFDKNSIYAI